jgi:iron complex transport system ATP-binding protein
MLYRLEKVGMRYPQAEVLRSVSFSLPAGQFAGVAGANGAGKSTLLTIMAGLRHGYTGSCFFEDKEVQRWKRRQYASRVSFVPQSVRIEFPFTAEQVVMMGRTPFCDGMFESPEDIEQVENAMRLTDTLEFRRRDFRSLSGGERQRVILASALAQSPRVLLLDEPAAFLDLQHQVSLFRLLRDLCRDGLLAVAVTHDLNLAAAYCSRLLILEKGVLVEDAPPEKALTPERLASSFGVQSQVVSTSTGRPWIVYGN